MSVSDLLAIIRKEWRVQLQYKYDHWDNADKKLLGEEEEEGAIPVVPFKQLKPTAIDHALGAEGARPHTHSRPSLTPPTFQTNCTSPPDRACAWRCPST